MSSAQNTRRKARRKLANSKQLKGALHLRGWALQLLGTAAGPSDSYWKAAARADRWSWELFLFLESCALALQSRLESRGEWSRLPAATAALIRDYATQELQRVLSARAQIKTVSRLAASHGWQVMVLKGGVAAADGELIDLGDLDILVAPDHVVEVADALERLGFEQQGLDHAAPHHLSARAMSNALHIEVHHKLKGGARLEAFLGSALPLAGEPTLWRQGAVDHLRYLLLHSTLQHPERTGRIRDLLLIGHALRTATPSELAVLEQELAVHEAKASILGVLRLARELGAGQFSADPYRSVALRTYVLFRRRWWFTRSRGGVQILVYATQILVHGWSHWRDAYRHLRAMPMNTISASPAIGWLERRYPLLADVARQLLRLLTFTAATTYALIAECEARWVERLR